MPASTGPSNDPFQPPVTHDRVPELVRLPRAPAPANEMAPAEVAPSLRPRRRVEYRRPGRSWVTVVILGFAAVGIAAVGDTAIKKVMGWKAMRADQPRAVVFSPLWKDDSVLVTIQVSPRNARLMLDGEPAVSNPLRIVRSQAPHTIEASARGFASARQEFTADTAKTIRLRLSRSK
jgi:hypothetical protein